MPQEGKPYVPGPDAVDISPKTNGSLIKEVLHKGTGSQCPFKGASVTVHYVGYLAADGTKFDSSRDRGEPFKFKLGKGEVIKGWDLGVATMVPGEVSVLVCAASMAYGEAGSPPKIPGDATLVFEVELLDFEKEDLSEAKDGGILRECIEQGSGYGSPSEGAQIKVRLTGTCGDQVFEDRTIEFELGEGSDHGIPPGIETALARFKKGEIAKIMLSPKYAFGSVGREGVPPDSAVEYNVELVSFVKRQEPWQMDAPEKLVEGKAQKEKGGKLFGEEKYARAVKAYKRVLDCLEHEKTSVLNEEQVELRNSLVLASHLNLSLCYLKEKEPRLALEQANKALEMEPNNIKGLFRRGQAQVDLHSPDLAKPDFQRVIERDPRNSAALQKLSLCNSLLKQQHEKEKKMFGHMFERLAKADQKKEEKLLAEQKQRESEIMTNVGEWVGSGVAPTSNGDA